MKMGKPGWVILGAFLGSYGLKILTSKDAKGFYTHCTAGVLRMKDQVVKDFTGLGENCGDIGADAKAINEKRAAAEESRVIENAREVVKEADEKEKAKKAKT